MFIFFHSLYLLDLVGVKVIRKDNNEEWFLMKCNAENSTCIVAHAVVILNPRTVQKGDEAKFMWSKKWLDGIVLNFGSEGECYGFPESYYQV